MSVSNRRKSCLPCVQGKRQCDSQRPCCTRCERHKKRCRYATPPESAQASCLTKTDEHTNALERHRHSSTLPPKPLSDSLEESSLQSSSTPNAALSIHHRLLSPRLSLAIMRYTDQGQKYDLERVLMGGPMSVVAKRKIYSSRLRHSADRYSDHATQKVEAMRGQQFYLALNAARAAGKIADFAKHFGTNEPVLQMDQKLRSWTVVQSATALDAPTYCRLKLFDGEPTLLLLNGYLSDARSRPATALIRAGMRYVELGLPYVCSFHIHRITMF